MLTVKIYINNKTRSIIKNAYGRDDYATVDRVISNIISRYLNIEYFDLELSIDDSSYSMCEFCEEKSKYSKIIDIDGKNIEEHKVCENCGFGQPALR